MLRIAQDADAENADADVDVNVEQNADEQNADNPATVIQPTGKQDMSREMQKMFREVGWHKNPAVMQLIKTKPQVAYPLMQSIDQAVNQSPMSMDKAKGWFKRRDLMPAVQPGSQMLQQPQQAPQAQK